MIVSVTANAELFEQTVGRTHRPGQVEDEVAVFLYLHTPELRDALDKAQARAKYVSETVGPIQKLTYGAWSS